MKALQLLGVSAPASRSAVAQRPAAAPVACCLHAAYRRPACTQHQSVASSSGRQYVGRLYARKSKAQEPEEEPEEAEGDDEEGEEDWDAALMNVAPDVEYRGVDASAGEEQTVFLVDDRTQSGEVQLLTGDQIPKDEAPPRVLPPGTLSQKGAPLPAAFFYTCGIPGCAECAFLLERNALAAAIQGYQSVTLEGLELLVAETPDGRLSLADSYIYDASLDIYARPEVENGLKLPSEALNYVSVPWVEEDHGEFLKYKKPVKRIKKVYYVGMSNEQPPRLRPDAVFLYDSKTRVFTAPPIHREREQLVEPTLRILRDGTVRVEEGSLMPPPGMVADMFSIGETGGAFDDALLSEAELDEVLKREAGRESLTA